MIHVPLVRLSLRTLLRSKKMIFAGLVSLLPLLAGILQFIATGFEADEQYFRYYMELSDATLYFILSGTLPLTALILAGGLMADEVEDRTLTYLLVRPIKRHTLFLSKALPVVLMTALLGVFQVVGLTLGEMITYASYGGGEPLPVRGPGLSSANVTVGAFEAIGLVFLGGAIAAALLGAGFAALFGLVSLITTRFHFFANLIIFVAWELPFSAAGSRGAGVLTFLHHARSIVERFDPTDLYLRDASAAWFSIPWMLVWAAAWIAIGAVIATRRDFNVTSAAS